MLSAEKLSYYYPPDFNALQNFQTDLQSLIKHQRKKEQPLVVICIGTDRATGDCLGPLVGQYLQHRTFSYSVYGSLSHPVHAQNLISTMKEIRQIHKNPFIIAIDACLGCQEHVGFITLSPMPLLPGLGVSKTLPPIGNMSITGIVNTASVTGNHTIQSTRLNVVVELASFISTGIEYSLPQILSKR